MTPAPTRYTDPRAHELRAEYLVTFSADEIPVPVESIAEDLLGLRIEERDLGECSGMLIPSERLIVVNAGGGDERRHPDPPPPLHDRPRARPLDLPRAAGRGGGAPTYCRSQDLSQDTDRDLEREANVFGAELLMPEAAVREVWAALPDAAEVAARFEVSALAAQWRLYSFGLAEKPA